MLQRKALKMSWLNHLFLVYILFYFPWPYLCNIFFNHMKWHCYIPPTYPLLSVRGRLGSTDFLSFVDSRVGGPFALLENGCLWFPFLFYSKLLVGAETGSGLWGWPPLAYVEPLETSYSSRAMWPSRGDMYVRAETSGSHPMEYGLWTPS